MTDEELVGLVDRVERRVADDGYDPATIWAAALERLGEAWADEERPLCPECGRRRVVRGLEWCRPCTEQRENDLAAKLRWWHKTHGNAGRLEADEGRG